MANTDSNTPLRTAQKQLESIWIELENAKSALPEEERKVLNRAFKGLVDLDRELERASIEIDHLARAREVSR